MHLLPRTVSRWVPVVALVTALAAGTAQAQWGTPPDEIERPTDHDTPRPRPTRDQELGTRLAVGGSILLVVSYAAAALWGGYYVDSLHLGPVGCNDTYAAWQFVPLVGPVVGVFAGGDCVPGGLHVEEAVLPFVFSILQLLGTGLATGGGVLLNRPPAAPVLSIAASANGALVSFSWRLE